MGVSSALSLLNFISPAHGQTVKPTTHIGTCQSKDEDGDGVPDDLDAYSYHRLA